MMRTGWDLRLSLHREKGSNLCLPPEMYKYFIHFWWGRADHYTTSASKTRLSHPTPDASTAIPLTSFCIPKD